MRILLIGPHFTGRWTESSQTALEALGHEVLRLYYDISPNEFRVVRLCAMSAVWSQHRRGAIHAGLHEGVIGRKHHRFVNIARDFSPHLIVILKGESIPLHILEDMRSRLNVPIVTWWVDDPFRFPNIEDSFAFYDWFFCFDAAYIPRLEEAGVRRPTFLPCACDPAIYKPMHVSRADRRRYGCDVAFVGIFFPPRDQLMLRMKGVDVAIWGPLWNSQEADLAMKAVGRQALRGKRLDSRQTARLYNAANICVNTHHDQSVHNGLNTRAFEIPACGALELVECLTGIHELLEPGKEIVCYESFDHARELADYYLERPKARAAIGRQGRARVLREHTYTHRMETLLATLAPLL